ncbi:MAG: TonB-dependent receptor [Chitinophagaceae bacterium]|nr:TonB-dependent receptor [Chitinophagaceae bacterium]
MKHLLAVAFLMIQIPLFAQSNTVTGKVTDATSGAVLEGASVVIKSSQRGTTTDIEGIFSIMANTDDVLLVTMIGYEMQSVDIGGRTEINIALVPQSFSLDDIVLVGTRGSGRSKIETPVPVDVVNMRDLSLNSGRMEVTSILNTAVPSFNYNRQSGSDGADHIDIATLRGMSPDQTLVLINGKRRHPASVVLLFGTRGQGSSGTDLNSFPSAAIERVEILRDGASAQYGSDAVAGVINFVLKKDINKLNVQAGYSGYYDPKFNPAYAKGMAENQYISSGKIDGNAFNTSIDGGFAVGKNGGFMHFSGEFTTQGKTFRQVLKSDDWSSYWSLPVNPVRRANGEGSSNTAGAFFNMEVPLNNSGKTSFYSFGGYNYKFSDDYAYTRSWSGIIARPDRFPTDGTGKPIMVPGIVRVTSGSGGVDTVYDPHIQTRIQDASIAAGFKGDLSNDWTWDASNTIGGNSFHFYGDKTFNASLGADKTHFDDGGYSFLQNTANLNFLKKIPGVGGGLNLAMGAELRYEQYKLKAGEKDSYTNYDPNNKDGGAQGFPGYQPSDEVNAHRTNVGVYVDGELELNQDWLLDGAIRAENYSDFGFTSNYKLAARYKAAHNLNLRGSVSTGFRAPSLQQLNFSSTLTAFQGNKIVSVKISPNYSDITRSAGIPALKQEKSFNTSLGLSWKPVNNLLITLDGYYIGVKDRIVLSGQFNANDPTLDPALIAEMQRTNVTTTQFFANAVNTSNLGVDIVVDYKKKFGRQYFNVLFAGNLQKMKITKINVPKKLSDTRDHEAVFFNFNQQSVLLASAPPAKFSMNPEYGIDRFSVGVRFTYFGKISFLGIGVGPIYETPMIPTDADPSKLIKYEVIYKGKIASDLYVSYKFSNKVKLFAGADNIFNVHPDLGVLQAAKFWSFNNQSGGPWDAVQMGQNGIRLFTRIALTL